MLKLNIGKGRQIIKLPQSVAILSLIPRPREEAMQCYATVATEHVGFVLYRALISVCAGPCTGGVTSSIIYTCSRRGLLDLPCPGNISDAGWVHTNVLCCPVQPPEASGAASGPWGGHQQGTANVRCTV